MKRFVLMIALGSFAAPGMALAESIQENIVDQLHQQGYSDVRVGRTLLGRTRIVAEGEGREREIVVNPRTGEILRDVWEAEEGPDLLEDTATRDAPADAETPEAVEVPEDINDGEETPAPEPEAPADESNSNRAKSKAMA